MEIHAEALQHEHYRPYGEVISAGAAQAGARANAGTAVRFDRLAAVENLRAGATPNVCVFRAQPAADNPFRIRLLERHRHSTQVFIPMAGAERYLVVVCGGAGAPELATMKAFVATGAQGVSYRPGIWHHPLIALDRISDFACLVNEDGSEGDCEERSLAVAPGVRY